jgi:hypothetical protein
VRIGTVPVLFAKETEMTLYMLSVHSGEAVRDLSDEEMQAAYKATGELNEEIKAEGSWVFAGGLHPADTATVVRNTGGEVVTTDGPFAETKEQLGGFWIVQLPDLDAALALAARASVACREAVEVRPFQDDTEA